MNQLNSGKGKLHVPAWHLYSWRTQSDIQSDQMASFQYQRLGFPLGPQMHLLHLKIKFGLPLSCRSFIAFNDVLTKDTGLLTLPLCTAAVRKMSSRSFTMLEGVSFYTNWLINLDNSSTLQDFNLAVNSSNILSSGSDLLTTAINCFADRLSNFWTMSGCTFSNSSSLDGSAVTPR